MNNTTITFSFFSGYLHYIKGKMIIPALPENEQERVSSVHQYHLLDTLPETDYDNITRIASEICKVPISLITIIDAERQFFKSTVGIGELKPRVNTLFAVTLY